MVHREISIQRFLYDRLSVDVSPSKPITILVVGRNDEKRNALCHTIITNIIKTGPTQTSQQTPSPFVFYDSAQLRLLAVREIDDNILSKKCAHIVLMEDATDLQKIWEASNCKLAVTRYETFLTIFHNCAKGLEVLWIDCKSDSPLVSKKLYWSNFVYTEPPVSNSFKVGDVTYDLPEKISHIDETDADATDATTNPSETVNVPGQPSQPGQPHGEYCSIL